MKTKLTLILVAIVLSINFSNAQEKSSNTAIEIGASLPELFHGGLRFKYAKNTRIDVKFGTDFTNNDADDKLYALSLNHAWYFGNTHEKTNEKTWTINSGLTLFMESFEDENSYASYLNLYVAKEIPITKSIFLQPELGVAFLLFENSVQNVELSTDFDKKVLPKFGINLIFEI